MIDPQSIVIPQNIPTKVRLAVLEWHQCQHVSAELDKLDQRVQKYNEAWLIVERKKVSESALATIAQAKAIAHQNGWHWEAIVSKILEDWNPCDQGLEVLRNYQSLLLKNDAKHSQFLEKMNEEAIARQEIAADLVRRSIELERGKAIEAQSEKLAKDKVTRARIVEQIERCLDASTDRQSLVRLIEQSKTKKAKRDLLNQVALSTNVKNFSLLEDALSNWVLKQQSAS